jgi:5-methylcytosine-specific restriction enzyme subunit McrC
LRGPDRAYRRREENLRLFKGKLKTAPHLRRNAAHRARFFCEYDEFTSDTELNRIFKAACRMLTASMRMPKTLEQLGHALLLLEDVQDVAVNAQLLDRVVIDRRNTRFEELFVFCRMLLEGHAPGAASGGTKTYSLLFDMNAVFEKFVSAFLQKRVLPQLPGHRLVEQGKRQGKFLVRQGGRGVLQLKPDLTVMAPDGGRLVIDTKWKRMQSEREDGRLRVGNADLYQLYAYANRFDARRSLLLYPKLPQSHEQDFELVDAGEKQTGHHLGVRFVNLHRRLSSATERQAMAEELKVMIQTGLAGTLLTTTT